MVWLLLASLGKLTKEKNDLSDKINQLLALQQTVQRKSMNSEKTDRFQMQIHSLKVSSVPRKRTGSHRVVENQITTLIVRLAELQQKSKSQPWRLSMVKGH